MSAFLGLLIEFINELVAHVNQTQTYTYFSILTLASGIVAFVLGLFALASQLRRRSLQKRNRLLIGLPVTILTLISVAPNFFDNPAYKVTPQTSQAQTPVQTPAATNAVMLASAMRTASSSVQTSATRTADAGVQTNAIPVDEALVKPGWYGERRDGNALLIVASYEENAFESRQFNRRLSRPVSYATFSVINLGSAKPIALTTFRVGVFLDSGEEVQSMAFEPLLSQNASINRDLLKIFSLPRTLGIGEMLSDIPICMAPGFSWASVDAVKVTLGGRDVLIPGRLMTAEEKRKALEHSTESSPDANTSGASETSAKSL